MHVIPNFWYFPWVIGWPKNHDILGCKISSYIYLINAKPMQWHDSSREPSWKVIFISFFYNYIFLVYSFLVRSKSNICFCVRFDQPTKDALIHYILHSALKLTPYGKVSWPAQSWVESAYSIDTCTLPALTLPKYYHGKGRQIYMHKLLWMLVDFETCCSSCFCQFWKE